LQIAAVAGPGEPLFNQTTFTMFRLLKKVLPDIGLCLSTNGLLLEEKAETVKRLGVETITVTVNTIVPEESAQLFQGLIYRGRRLVGTEASELLVAHQLNGIKTAVSLGIIVKVNTILVPTINRESVLKTAEEVKSAGASLMNIVPLIPAGKMSHVSPPSLLVLDEVCSKCERIIPQFHLCKQCRADACGVPGLS
jgi:nitrogen fixation protein NifB